jgi:AmmeMemoRadiSam system protein B
LVAGSFYPGSAEQCRVQVKQYLAESPSEEITAQGFKGRPVGGIVPHAGWVYSGAVAAEVIKLLTAGNDLQTCVIFGAWHRPTSTNAMVFPAGSWQTPMGEIEIDQTLASQVVQASPLILDQSSAHNSEHSIEVQIPFIQNLAPQAKLLPIVVPATPSASEVGQAVAEQVTALDRQAVYLGSTDLTHYGPSYGFTPQGSGQAGLEWAKETNDRRIIDLMIDMSDDEIVNQAASNHNACGSGAVAATIRACKTAGADRAKLLQHTTSAEVAREIRGAMSDAVGYAGVIFYQST